MRKTALTSGNIPIEADPKKTWNRLLSAYQKMVNGFGRSPITGLLAITLRIGKPAGYTRKPYGFIPSKQAEHPFLKSD